MTVFCTVSEIQQDIGQNCWF